MNPAEFSSYIVSSTIISTEYSNDYLLKALKNITIECIKNYIINIFKNTALTSFIYGNIKMEDATDLFHQFNNLYLNCNNALPIIKSLNSTTINHPNNNEKQNSISYYYPIGTFNPINYILLTMTVYILNQPFFNELRTKSQLGYLVSMNIYSIRDYYYITQKIQSGKDVIFVENKINEFNKTILSIIKNCHFETFIETIKHELEERDICISDKYYKFLPEISFKKYFFNRNKILLDKLKTVTKKDLINFIKNYIINGNKLIYIIKGN
jgi:nardilysin